MINNIVLIGKLISEPEIKEITNGNKMCNLTLEVTRSFPSSDGSYQSDIITVSTWRGVAEETAARVHAGNTIGIKGRLSAHNVVSKNGVEYSALSVIAEDVSCIA